MAYIQKNSPFKQTATKAALGATKQKSGSSYDKFIDNTASYLKGEQGLIPDSITGGKPTRQAIGDGIRKVANSIDPSKKTKKVKKPNGPQETQKSNKPLPAPSPKPSEPNKPTKQSRPARQVHKRSKPSKRSKAELNRGYLKEAKNLEPKPSIKSKAIGVKGKMQKTGIKKGGRTPSSIAGSMY